MDLATLLSEFYSLGFQYLSDGGSGAAQATRWINRARDEINGEAPWPFLEAVQTGAAPLTLTNASGQIESVYDVSNNRVLPRRSRRELQVEYGDNLTQSGTPFFWYRTDVGTVNVYPVAAVTLSVRHFKTETALSANSDTPLMPARFHPAIVDLAASFAHRSAGNQSMADGLAADAQRLIDKMVIELLGEEPVTMPLVGGDC